MQESFSEGLQDLSALDKQVLVERHLISREHAAKGAGSAVVVNRRQTLSIMINEEDHLRMQSIRSGLQLKQAFKLVDKVDSALESKLDFAEALSQRVRHKGCLLSLQLSLKAPFSLIARKLRFWSDSGAGVG